MATLAVMEIFALKLIPAAMEPVLEAIQLFAQPQTNATKLVFATLLLDNALTLSLTTPRHAMTTIIVPPMITAQTESALELQSLAQLLTSATMLVFAILLLDNVLIQSRPTELLATTTTCVLPTMCAVVEFVLVSALSFALLKMLATKLVSVILLLVSAPTLSHSMANLAMTLMLVLNLIPAMEVSALEPTQSLALSTLAAMPLVSVTPPLVSVRLLAAFVLELCATTHLLATLEVFVTS